MQRLAVTVVALHRRADQRLHFLQLQVQKYLMHIRFAVVPVPATAVCPVGLLTRLCPTQELHTRRPPHDNREPHKRGKLGGLNVNEAREHPK